MAISQGSTSQSSTHSHDERYFTEAEVTSLLSGKSGSGHDHSGVYSAVGHNHDGVYSASGHNHSGVYATAAHTHAYSADTHNHTVDALSNVSTSGKSDGQVLTWNAGGGQWQAATVATGGGGVTDHGALTGLGDDDHTQYYNQARGDARYALSGHNHTGVYATTAHTHDYSATYSALAHNHTGVYATVGHTHDDRYYTETETNALLTGYSPTTHNHTGVYATTAHTHDDRYFTEAEITGILSGKAPSIHTHGDLYYTESEITSLLAAKSDASHVHDSGTIGAAEAGSGVAYTYGTHWSAISGTSGIIVKKFGNMVSLICQAAKSASVNTTAATLAAGYRPTSTLKVLAYNASTYGANIITINTDGTIVTTTGSIAAAITLVFNIVYWVS